MSDNPKLQLTDEYGDTGSIEIYPDGSVFLDMDAQNGSETALALDLPKEQVVALLDFLQEHCI